jgi:hypothetical protein
MRPQHRDSGVVGGAERWLTAGPRASGLWVPETVHTAGDLLLRRQLTTLLRDGGQLDVPGGPPQPLVGWPSAPGCGPACTCMVVSTKSGTCSRVSSGSVWVMP